MAITDSDIPVAQVGASQDFPVLLIGAEVLPWKISVKGLRREAGTCRRRALDGDLSR